MGNSMGIVGNAARDHFLPEAKIVSRDGGAVVCCNGRQWDVRPRQSVTAGAKLTVPELPDGLLQSAEYVCYGGGGVNSCMSVRRTIAPDLPVHYLDSCQADPGLAAIFRDADVDIWFLGMRPVPPNVVLGDRTDKVILKSPISDAVKLDRTQQGLVAWLTGTCPAILANSVKDRRVMEALTAAATAQQVRLSAVLTQSLPPPFVNDVVLPAASTIISSWDEISYISGFSVAKTIRHALRAVSWLHDQAPQARIFLTMGKQGALVSDEGNAVAYHIRLNRPHSEEVQAVVAPNPSCVCGCGDSFAAGVFAYLEAKRSLLSSAQHRVPTAVAAGISGCIAALRWLGYACHLGADDFGVSCLSAG